MTSFNVLYCRQWRTELSPQVTCAENLVKFAHVFFEICDRTDRQLRYQWRNYKSGGPCKGCKTWSYGPALPSDHFTKDEI